MIQLDTWRLRHRFAAPAAVTLLACAPPSASQFGPQWRAMRSARLEAGSAAPLRSLFELVQLTQQHRGLAAVLLGCKSDTADMRAARQREAWQRAGAGLRDAPLSPTTRRQLGAASREWVALREAVGSGGVDVAASLARHSALVGQLLTALESISDDHGLSLDANMGRYQLDQATQQNAALVEESAAAANSLRQQSLRLAEAVGAFRG